MDLHWQGSVDIAAPTEQVYTYLADFPKHCEWAQTLERMEQTKPPGPNGTGAVYKTYEVQDFQSDRQPGEPLPSAGTKAQTECTVTELKPSQRIAWKAKPLPVGLGVHAELSFDLEPAGDNATKLTQTVDFHQPALIGKAFARFVAKKDQSELMELGKAQYQASLDNIKTVIESETNPSAPA